MFNLNTAMDDWRSRLGGEGGLLPADVAELEEHLREETARLATTGLTEEEAFLVSARRLGRVDLLGQEFEKINSPSIWLNRFRWMALGGLAYAAASIAMNILSTGLLVGTYATGLVHPGVAGAIGSLVAFALVAVAVVLWARHLLRRERPSSGLLPSTRRGRCFLLAGVGLFFVLLPFCGQIGKAVVIRTMMTQSEFVQTGVASQAIVMYMISILLPVILAGWVVMGPRWARTA